MSTTEGTINFRMIKPVPDSKTMIDIVLSNTQRRTPTEIHKQFKISRIRGFYIRKVAHCKQVIVDYLDGITKEFPRLDNISPFYADLCNIMYDRDHYKLALGHCHAIRRLMETISKDYTRLIKYGDSLYKCKCLKRAAFGRMCSGLKKLDEPLKYLEAVRQSLSRLPTINPNDKTLILTGYPNVGKSSFMNLITRANVEVQPFAFTTKSLYVGHFDYQYARWQVIDTPGLLDRPLEEKNSIEMMAITALAHIEAGIIFFVDISEACGYSVAQQVAMYHSLKPLFKNKPLLCILNKVDLRPSNTLAEEEKAAIQQIIDDQGNNSIVYDVSTLDKTGVNDVLLEICRRVTENATAKNLGHRQPCHISITSTQPHFEIRHNIPQSVISKRCNLGMNDPDNAMNEMIVEKKKTQKQLEEENGGPGVYSSDWRADYKLKDNEWAYDEIPQIYNGYNISDFMAPDIPEQLAKLEEEAAALESQPIIGPSNEWRRVRKTLKKVGIMREEMRLRHKLRKFPNRRVIARSKQAGPSLDISLPGSGIKTSAKRRIRTVISKLPRSTRNLAIADIAVNTKPITSDEIKASSKTQRMMILSNAINKIHKVRSSRQSQSQLLSMPKEEQQLAAAAHQKRHWKTIRKHGKKGEGDHHIPSWKPKHLNNAKVKLKIGSSR